MSLYIISWKSGQHKNNKTCNTNVTVYYPDVKQEKIALKRVIAKSKIGYLQNSWIHLNFSTFLQALEESVKIKKSTENILYNWIILYLEQYLWGCMLWDYLIMIRSQNKPDLPNHTLLPIATNNRTYLKRDISLKQIYI